MHTTVFPDDDSDASGGAIDTKVRVTFTQLVANNQVEAVSTSGSDAQTMTVVGRTASGVLAQESKALTGATAVPFDTVYERILAVSIPSDADGTITVRIGGGGATVGTIPAGERGFRSLFIGAASVPDAAVTRYEKFFWKNAHGSLALLEAAVSQYADPEGVIEFALASAADDSGSVANRLAAPGGLTFNDTDKTVPGTDLAPGSAIGVWLKQTLPAAQEGFKSSWTSRLQGNSV